MGGNDDFVVETDGRCFMCFKSASYLVTQSQASRIYSLQCLTRFLKMELSSVFNEKGSIPPHLLAKVERARLKVELCERCTNLNETFSKLYSQLEKIEMEVGSCVKLIQRTFLEAEGTVISVELNSFQDSQLNHGKEGIIGKLEIVKVLRSEAIRKCSDKLTSVQPRVEIKRLSTKQLTAKNITTTHFPEVGTGDSPHPKMLNELKLESQTANFFSSNEKNDDEFNFEGPEMHGQELEESMDEVIPSQENEVKPETTSRSSFSGTNSETLPREAESKSRCVFNPQTGKYRCNLCQKEFNKRAFDYHYKNIHLNVRYKCTLCDKEFTQKSTFKDHYDNIHLHIRFKCRKCSKIFKTKGQLRQHGNKCGLIPS